MKVLVLGASSFIGRNFLLGCPKQWKVYGTYNKDKDFLHFLKQNKLGNAKAFQCNLLEQDSVKKLFQQINDFDAVLFLVANLSIPMSFKNPYSDLRMNTLTLLHVLSEVRCKKFIYFSSGAVYDGIKGKVNPAVAVNPKIPYALSKLASEHYVEFYSKQGNIGSYINVRFFGAYGHYELSRKVYSKIIDEFVVRKKSSFDVYGNGKNLIDAMYVDDAVRAIVLMMQSKKGNMALDLCIGKPLTIDSLVIEAGKILTNKEIKINHIGKTFEPVSFIGSAKEMKNHFGFTPQIGLKEGLLRLKSFIIKGNYTRKSNYEN